MRLHRLWLLSLAVLVGELALSATLENAAISIELRPESSGLGVVGVTDRKSGVRFVAGAELGADFWEIAFHAKGVDGKTEVHRLTNRSSAVKRAVEKTSGGWLVRWQGLDLPGEKQVVDVTARVCLAKSSPSCSWELSVDCRSSRWGLYETSYPCLRGIVGEDEADVMMPSQCLGERLYRNHRSSAVTEVANYPGWRPMVAAYMKDGTGLYVAAHDPEARIKRMEFLKGHDLRFVTPVENAGVPGRAADGPKYPVVIATYAGDWWGAAKLYRRWATKQKWCRKGKLAERADHPRRMSEAHAWLLSVGGGTEVSNFVNRVKARWPDVKFGVEITQWGNQPFDVDYPEMLPTRKRIPETFAWAERVGVPLMPYMNGRLWDTELASWHYGSRDCTMSEDGTPNLEEYGRRSFGVMCPSAADWQQCYGRYVVRLCDITKCSFVYLDQVTCSQPALCFNPAHGHPLGGGSWWAEGYRKMLEPVHAALSSRNVPITSEGAGEFLFDVVDGYLLACAPREEDVPFYTAVYGGYATYFGSFLKAGTDFPSYYAVSARALLWGIEPGWYHCWPVEDKYRRWGDALAEMSRTRERAGDFLAYGSLEGDVGFSGRRETVERQWENPMGGTNVFHATFPAVMGTWWKDASGRRRAVALANLTDASREVAFERPFAGTVKMDPYSVRVIEEK